MPASYSIHDLFRDRKAIENPVWLHWRLIRRNGRPFLLLPTEPKAARAGLQLYSAQRSAARLGQKILSSWAGIPLFYLFPRFSVQADRESVLMRFLAKQAATNGRLLTPSILFTSRTIEKQRFVLLVPGRDGATSKVVKVGLAQSARVIERECELISKLPADCASSTEVLDSFSVENLSGFSIPFYSGSNPAADDSPGFVLKSWLRKGPVAPLESLDSWRQLSELCSEFPHFRELQDSLSDVSVRSPLSHGDFTSWNVRVNAAGEWKVFDWERGELNGVPGWDWFHFVIQNAILVKRLPTEEVADLAEELVHSSHFEEYALAAGISRISRQLMLGYLLRQDRVIRPEHGAETTRELYQVLSRRWLTSSMRPSKTAVPELAEISSVGREPARPYSFMQTPLLDTLRTLVRWLAGGGSTSAQPHESFLQKVAGCWKVILFSWTFIIAAAIAHSFASPHMVFTPFYLVPCGLLTLCVNRRWGFVAALVSGLAGPLVQRAGDPDYAAVGILAWNAAMRFAVFAMFVLLLDRIRPEMLRMNSQQPRSADA